MHTFDTNYGYCVLMGSATRSLLLLVGYLAIQYNEFEMRSSGRVDTKSSSCSILYKLGSKAEHISS